MGKYIRYQQSFQNNNANEKPQTFALISRAAIQTLSSRKITLISRSTGD